MNTDNPWNAELYKILERSTHKATAPTPPKPWQYVKKGQHNTRKTHCPKGHPYNEENTIRHPFHQARACRACRDARYHTPKRNHLVKVYEMNYRLAHKHAPRGRGLWSFCPTNRYQADNYLDFVKVFSGPYSLARNQAVKHFQANGILSITVCP